jgi:hypothetical protein
MLHALLTSLLKPHRDVDRVKCTDLCTFFLNPAEKYSHFARGIRSIRRRARKTRQPAGPTSAPPARQTGDDPRLVIRHGDGWTARSNERFQPPEGKLQDMKKKQNQTRGLCGYVIGAGAMTLALIMTSATAQAQTEGATIRANAGDAAPGDNFGQAVAISGDYAVVGAFRDDPGEAGKAYIFHFNGTTWLQQAVLKPSGQGTDDWFGSAVAIDGDVAVVGAPDHSDTGIDSGAVWVYRRTGATWMQEAKLLGSGRALNDRYGHSVAVEGNRIVVGASQFFASGGGKAYVYDYNGVAWVETLVLEPVALESFDHFGIAVDISGNTVVVGANGDDGPANSVANSGAAYVFVDNAGVWSLQASLSAGDGTANDQFGFSVAIDDDRMAIGAPQDDGGALYVFDRSSGSWTQSAKVLSASTISGDQLGASVDVDGDVLVGGAPVGFFGAGYVAIFQRSGASWLEDTLTSPSSPLFGSGGDQFGTSVALEGTLVLGGAPGNDDGGPVSDNRGSATFYQVDPLPTMGDTDGDGASDALEIATANGGPCPSPFDPDSDDDGLSDGQEINFGPDACNPDVDNDGLEDGMEGAFGTGITDPDSDDDGMLDGEEVDAAAGSGCPNPLMSDSDGDTLNDGFETGAALDPCDADSDGDGLSDPDEINNHETDPTNPDTDGDNLDDGAEVTMAAGGACPDPLDADSDNDGIEDGDELTAGAGPCDIDSDDDGLADGNEASHGTGVLDPDSDDDGLLDGAEVDAAMGSGCPSPTDADSDNDGLSDSAEVTATTSTCNPDTDGDGLDDSEDPNPLVPEVTPTALASMTFATAGEFIDTPVNQFLGPTSIVKQVRRATLATTTALAAVAIQNGQYSLARALLQTVENLIDGDSPPADWMVNGAAKTQIHNDVQTLLILLDMID